MLLIRLVEYLIAIILLRLGVIGIILRSELLRDAFPQPLMLRSGQCDQTDEFSLSSR